jgi:3-hydroxybutyryl-CoA dehydratase
MTFKVGDKFDRVFEVTPEVYAGFLTAFGDRNILHVDDRYAKSKGFTGVVMHGNILNGFISYFVGECLPVKNVILHSQQISYLRPAYLGDALKFEAVVEDASESVQAFTLEFTFRNAAGVKIAKGTIGFGLI